MKDKSGSESNCWIALFLIPVLLLQAGCVVGVVDGGISVSGQVYEWVNPPANIKTEIYVDNSPVQDGKLVTLEGAKIVLFHRGDYSWQRIDETTIWKHETASKKNGSFSLGGVTSPSRFHAAMRVSKDGFLPAEKVFLHDKLWHTAVVIMVRNTDQTP